MEAYPNSPSAKSENSIPSLAPPIPRLSLEVMQEPPPPEKFSAAFIEKRMQQHAAAQAAKEYELVLEIVREVEAGILQKILLSMQTGSAQ